MLSSKTSRSQKPGHIIPSKMTDTFSYDTSNKNRGTAIIFNHEYVVGETRRRGTKKDGDDLKAVLEELGFDVTVYDDLELKDIKTVLREG